MNSNARIAPLQLLVIGFDEPQFTGKIAAELNKARDNKLIRVVDGVVVLKDKDGSIRKQEKSDLSFEEIGTYGAVLGALLGLGSGNEDIARESASRMRESFEDRYEYGLDKEDVEDIAKNLPNDSAAMFILIEHIWAAPIRDALRESGGMLISQDFLSPELLIGIGQQTFAEATA